MVHWRAQTFMTRALQHHIFYYNVWIVWWRTNVTRLSCLNLFHDLIYLSIWRNFWRWLWTWKHYWLLLEMCLHYIMCHVRGKKLRWNMEWQEKSRVKNFIIHQTILFDDEWWYSSLLEWCDNEIWWKLDKHDFWL